MTSSPAVPVQLPLAIALPSVAGFASFLGAANREAVARLCELVGGMPFARARLWLVGATGSGKSHLLRAAAETTAQLDGGVAWLDAQPNIIAARDCALLCIDDAERVAGDREREAALLQVLEEANGVVLFASTLHPSVCDWCLADVRSRVLAGEVLRLAPLTDAERAALLHARAAAVGLALPSEVAGYLLARLPRDTRRLLAAMDSLDAASWQTQRRLTVPFVRTVLGELA